MTAVAIIVLAVAAIAALTTTDDRERAERLLREDALRRRAEAQRRHPSNYVDALDQAVEMVKPRSVSDEVAAYLAAKAAGR